MKLSEILVGAACVLEMKARSKAEALGELAGALAAAVPGLEREVLLAMMREREQLGTTALGGGIAIPHARLDSAGRMLASFGRSHEGVDFDSIDGGPTHLFFVLVAPARDGAQHLVALARLSRMLGSESFRARLASVHSTDELLRAVVEEEARV
jgi:PTS system nitrogen regulatory IIA component